ncbi:tumor necrosis factor receptor superfamily member 16-like, partial [Actinia tenebrosa]|uniref:Tumor necrosis factor receptor superfamily member 16-like n=1 Tax=Actinia tenebrosa TaxID=6105 RepID=A0A6P8IMM5_ACTTE
NDGKYLDPGILFCVVCDACKPGYGAERPCSTESNTVCLPCTPGKTYSNITSFSIPCKACTACPAGYSIKRKCTNITDTVCQLTPSYVNSTHATQTKTRNSKGPVSTTDASIATEASKKDFVIPLVVGVSCFILGLLIFLIVKVYKRLRARERQPEVAHRYSDGEEAIPIKSKVAPLTKSRHGALRGRHTRHLRRNDSSRDSDSQGSSTGSLQEEKPRDPERLFRDLPNEPLVIEDLALSLNPKSRNNWVRLAGELGYSKIQIDNFGIDPTQATQNLLADWRTMRNSTIGVLYACLQKIGRQDACEVLDRISGM